MLCKYASNSSKERRKKIRFRTQTKGNDGENLEIFSCLKQGAMGFFIQRRFPHGYEPLLLRTNMIFRSGWCCWGDHSVVGRDQAPSGLRIFKPRISRTGFCLIPGLCESHVQNQHDHSVHYRLRCPLGRFFQPKNVQK